MTEPTQYEVLSLPQDLIEDSPSEQTAQIIKHSYHRALLRHHPDKAAALAKIKPTTTTTSSASSTSQSTPSQPIYTIDQIVTAYTILSNPSTRAEYNAHLRTKASRSHQSRSTFQTGIETVDLDDLASATSPESGQTEWFRPCRCGNERGFAFGEADLEEAGDLGELIVGCQDCSLWLRVYFAVVEDEDGTADGNGNGNAVSGEPKGEGSGRGGFEIRSQSASAET